MQTQAVEVRKIEFAGIRGTSATEQAIKLACSDAVPCRDLELRNVNLTMVGGGAASAFCHRASEGGRRRRAGVLPRQGAPQDARRRHAGGQSRFLIAAGNARSWQRSPEKS